MSTSWTICCVRGCPSARRKHPEISFHKFPHCSYVKNLWEVKLKLDKPASKWLRICSSHFKANDFERSGWSTYKRLLPSAIPSMNLPLPCQDKQFEYLQLVPPAEDNDKHTQEFDSDPDMPSTSEKKYKDVGTQVEFDQYIYNFDKRQCKDAGTQVEVNDLCQYVHSEVQVSTEELRCVSDFVTKESQLNSLTGIATFQLLETLARLVQKVAPVKRLHRLSTYKRVFLVFMKLKLDLPYVVLAILFGVSRQTCRSIFFETIDVLAPILKTAIPFPSSAEIQQNLPKCFKKFSNVRIVLDCTEIPVQQPKSLCCKVKLYSQYKGTTTVKFMTGVTPAGLISFVSAPYGGRVSDSTIFRQSSLCQRIAPGEALMVDKGFLIDDICKQYGIQLIRPPFLRNKKRFSHEEALSNAEIASARVHIERDNQRMKVFKIINSKLPVNLLSKIGNIMTVICGIVNLSNPILASDKFMS